jgi:hypothetical protein
MKCFRQPYLRAGAQRFQGYGSRRVHVYQRGATGKRLSFSGSAVAV